MFLTLIDTHLAALISAAFLFQFGTGPIRGFAVTLFYGLISNLFTATFVSKTLFELELSRQVSGHDADRSNGHAHPEQDEYRLHAVAVRRRPVMGRDPGWPWHHRRPRVCRVASRVRRRHLGAPCSLIIHRATMRCARTLNRNYPGGGQDAIVQAHGAPTLRTKMIRVPTWAKRASPAARRSRFEKAIRAGNLGNFTVVGTEIVGPAVGKELSQRGLIATVLSLVGLLAYIAFRYQLSLPSAPLSRPSTTRWLSWRSWRSSATT